MLSQSTSPAGARDAEFGAGGSHRGSAASVNRIFPCWAFNIQEKANITYKAAIFEYLPFIQFTVTVLPLRF